jgi:hypothetical protein
LISGANHTTPYIEDEEEADKQEAFYQEDHIQCKECSEELLCFSQSRIFMLFSFISAKSPISITLLFSITHLHAIFITLLFSIMHLYGITPTSFLSILTILDYYLLN